MKKRSIPLLMAAVLTFAGCSAGTGGSYTTKVQTSDERIVTTAQFTSGDEVNQMDAPSDKPAQSEDKESEDKGSGDKGSGNLPKVWFINNANGIGWSAAFTSSMNETFDTDEYDYTFVDGQGQFDVQLAGIEDAIAAKADVVCFSAYKEDGYDEVLKKAKDAGVKVFLVDRMIDADESLYEGWLGSNFDLEGENAGKWLVDKAGGEDMNIVVLQGNEGGSAQKGRHDGFNRIVEASGNFTILAEEIADFDKGKAEVLMQDYLDRFGDKIDVIVTQNDTMCYGVMETLEANNIDPNDYIIISFDGEAEAFKLMMDNAKLDLCVECNPLIGPDAKKVIDKLLAGETIERTNYVTEGVFPAETAADELENRQF